jgi:hypothetical protein
LKSIPSFDSFLKCRTFDLVANWKFNFKKISSIIRD